MPAAAQARKHALALGVVDVKVAAIDEDWSGQRRRPDLITAAWWKEERGQRVFVVYNQNAPHKTVFGAWSSRPGRAPRCPPPATWRPA